MVVVSSAFIDIADVLTLAIVQAFMITYGQETP